MTKKIDLFTIKITDNVRTAMEKITANKHRAVVVLDGRKVVGTVSDGDVRRALLKEILPIAPVEEIMNINCRTTTETDPGKQREILSREKVTLLPVINKDNELIDVALAYEPFE
ncbi:MAG: CBS domain-containing protein [Candidatus Omnitrophica bacterium]|nr:CBS domain-containing protein [Candidatus Omnitrophota bacterium]